MMGIIGARRFSVVSTSRRAAAWSDVITAIARGRCGNGRLRAGSNSPSPNSRLRRSTSSAISAPSDAFTRQRVFGVPCHYVKPVESGNLPFDDACFDLLTCFGVLHHIPNVSHVVGELARCLKPGGYALMREPVISMGDWRQPRAGLTR